MGESAARFILKKYNLFYKSGQTPEWYTQKINTILYKGFPIFKVQYVTWSSSKDVFTIPYKKTGANCFATERTFIKYKELYS